MNKVENEKLKFKEITYIKSEYARLVMLAFLSAYLLTYIRLLSCFVVGRNTLFRYEHGQERADGCQNETDNIESDLPSGLESSRNTFFRLWRDSVVHVFAE